MTQEIRDQLIAERGRLSMQVEALRDDENVTMSEQESTRDLSSDDQHPAEQGIETFDRERDMSLLENLEKEMDEVQAALDRLEEGTYGRCEICGRPIGAERLQALPATRYCVEHEQVRESLYDRPPGTGSGAVQ